jgi:ubiquinone/menaquinone biosynthesis C-methylase UbiE
VHAKEHWNLYHKQWEQRETIPANPRIIKAILLLFDIKNKRILEVGSGSGRDSIYLAKMGADCYLLDYVQAPLDIAEKIAKQNDVKIKTFKEDAKTMPFEDDSIDLVFSQGFLEHFTEPEIFLKEQVRVLKPGGCLYIDVPQKYHVYTLIKHALMVLNKWTPGWETEFTVSQLENLVSEISLQTRYIIGDWSNPPFMLKIIYAVFRKNWHTKEFDLNGKKSSTFLERIKSTRFAQNTSQHIGIIAQKKTN